MGAETPVPRGRGPRPCLSCSLRSAAPVAVLGRDMGFGEGNFQALYDSIELDQKPRGVL